MGGISAEHDVSMNSGSGMLKNLDSAKFLGFPIIISKENTWIWSKSIGKKPPGEYSLDRLTEQVQNPSPEQEQARFTHFINFPKCDIMLIGLHGEGGEDGKLQGFLDLCGQAYTGSGCLGSAIAMDKIRSKEIFKRSGILTPRYKVLDTRSLPSAKELEEEFGLPLVLKLPQGGSSLGMAIPQTLEELELHLLEMGKLKGSILVEEYIKGREATCGYIENYESLPPTEIVPMQDSFFNYEAKYDSERTKEITPGDFAPSLTQKMQTLAEQCHKLLGLSVYSRTDYLLKDERLYVLETNSLPGFTNASILPQEAEAAGLSYSGLLTKIIEESLKK